MGDDEGELRVGALQLVGQWDFWRRGLKYHPQNKVTDLRMPETLLYIPYLCVWRRIFKDSDKYKYDIFQLCSSEVFDEAVGLAKERKSGTTFSLSHTRSEQLKSGIMSAAFLGASRGVLERDGSASLAERYEPSRLQGSSALNLTTSHPPSIFVPPFSHRLLQQSSI